MIVGTPLKWPACTLHQTSSPPPIGAPPASGPQDRNDMYDINDCSWSHGGKGEDCGYIISHSKCPRLQLHSEWKRPFLHYIRTYLGCIYPRRWKPCGLEAGRPGGSGPGWVPMTDWPIWVCWGKGRLCISNIWRGLRVPGTYQGSYMI